MGRIRLLGVLLAVFVSAFAAAPAHAQNPLIHWPLDSVATSPTPDISGNGLNGTVINAGGSVADGRFGGAVRTGGNGSSSRVQRFPVANLHVQAFTVVTWIRSRNPGYPGDGAVIELSPDNCDPAIWRFWNENGDLAFATHNSPTSYIAGADVYDGRWHMIAASVQGNIQRTYLDGAPLAISTITDPPAAPISYGPRPNNLSIGGRCSDTADDVDVDDFRFYATNLTAAQVGYLSRSRHSDPPELPAPPSDPGWSGLVGQWHLEGWTFYGSLNSSGATQLSGGGNGTFTTARFGKGIAHSSSAHGLRVPDNAALEPAHLTAMAWVKRASTPAAGTYILAKGSLPSCNGNSYRFNTATDGSLEFAVATINGATVTLDVAKGGTAGSLWNGQWHAIAGTYDGIKVELWIDGVKVATDPVTAGSNIIYTEQSPGFGLSTNAHPNSSCSATSWGGEIDEVRVYDRALFTDEITWLQDPAATVPRDLPNPQRAPEPGPVNITKPAIVGSAPYSTGANQQTCQPGTWNGSPTSYTYLWERGARAASADDDPSWAPINGASGPNYVPTEADAGMRFRCRVIAANFKGTGEAVSPSRRADPSKPNVITAPVVTGVPAAGQIVVCDPGTWTNFPTFSYQWFRDGEGDIPGATNQSYTVTRRYNGRSTENPNGDGNRKIGCRVTADNDIGASSGSSASHLAMDGQPLANDRPTLAIEDRANSIGRKLICNPGSYLNFTGDEPGYGFTYSWYRNGQPIVGAVGAEYVLTADDLGTAVACGVVATNPLGSSSVVTSRPFDVPLPQTYTEPSNWYVQHRDNPFDPVNLMMLPQAYNSAIYEVVLDRLNATVAAEIAECRKLPGLPNPPNLRSKPRFPLTVEVRCSILVRDPGGYNVSANGVQWTRGGSCKPGARQGEGACPDMGFVIPPVDPSSAAALNPVLEAKIKATVPDKVIWDLDGDGKTDLVCPGTAPVARALLKPGRFPIRGVATFSDSATTNRYGVVTFDVTIPGNTSTVPKGELRKPTQPMWCRTSIVPPPDPKTAPCTDHGEVGGITITGNLCPINLRATDPDAFEGLDDEVYEVLDRAAQAIAEAEQKAENPKLVRKERGVLLAKGMGSETTNSNPLKPADMMPSPLRRVEEHVVASRDAASSLLAFTSAPPTQSPYVGTERVVANEVAHIRKFKEEKAQFALDQIYAVKGDLDMNGVTIEPSGNLPTLIVPSDSGEAIPYVADVKKMTVNAKKAVTKMAVQKVKDGVKQQLGEVPLSPPEGINQLLSDLPNAAPQVLKDKINLDDLRKSLGKKLDMGPFKLAGTEAKIKLQNNGTALIEAEAELVGLENADGNLLRTQVTLLGDIDGNIQLQGVKLEQKKDTVAFMFGIELQKLFLEYNPTGGLTVRGQITFRAAGGQGIDIRNFSLGPEGQFRSLDVDYLAGAGTGIMIAPGVFLTKLGGGLYTQPEKAIRAGAAVSAIAPSAGGGCPTVGTEGDVTVKWDPKPFLVHVVGRVGVVCIPIGKLELRASTDGIVEIKGDWGVDLKVIKMTAVFNGNIRTDPNLWQIDYSVRGELPFLSTFLKSASVSVKGVLSNRGLGACANFFGIDAGVGVHFSNGRPPFTYAEFLANLRPFFLGCGLEDFASVPVRAAQAPGGPRSFDMKESEPTMLSIEGPGDVPRVRLKSPDGRVLDFSDAVGGKQVDNTLGVILEDEDRTAVLLPKPAKGTWTVESVEGSAPVVAVRMAGIAPKPSVRGRVTGRGSTRTLTYSVKNIRDQVVNFVEEAEGGHKVVKTVRGGGSGKVTYTVDEARGSVRELKAHVVQNDMPRATIVVGRYRAPNAKIGRPKVRIKRRGTRAVVTWSKAALADSYLVNVSTGSGERYTSLPKKGKRTVTLTGIGKSETVTVAVVGQSEAGRRGPAGKAKLTKPKKKSRGRR